MGNGAEAMGYYIPTRSRWLTGRTIRDLDKEKEQAEKRAKNKLESSIKYSISDLTVTDEQRKNAKSISNDSLDTDRKLALMQLDMVINRQKVARKKGLSKEIESKINDDATVLIKMGVIKRNAVRNAIIIMVDSCL